MSQTFKTAYGPKLKVTQEFIGPGKTKQSFKAECDINNIMARFQRTGVLDFARRFEPRYGDATGVDFQAAMKVVADAKTMFQELPSSVRAKFKNDPGTFLDWINNPANANEAVEMGLATPKEPVAEPKAAEATPPAPPPPAS